MQATHDIRTIETDDGEWITAQDLARRLRMTEAWVYTQTRAGLIPHVRLGRYIRYHRRAIDAWLASIARATPTQSGGTRTPELRAAFPGRRS